MKIRKRSFKDYIDELELLIDWKGVLLILSITSIVIYFIFFNKRELPDGYNILIEAQVLKIDEKITMKQSKYYGNYSKLVGWYIIWGYTSEDIFKKDSVFLNSVSLNKNQFQYVSDLKVGSKIKVKYNNECKKYLDVGE